VILEDVATFSSSTLSNNDEIQCVVGSSNICATPSNVSSSIINVTVNPLPTVSAIFTSLSGGVLVAATGFASYQWILNGALISGANSSNYIPLANGNYSVTVTNEFGCENSANAIVGNLSLNEQDLEQISIFPNPSDGIFVLDFGTKVPHSFTILNTLGEIVFINAEVKNSETVNLSHLSSGLYYLTFQRKGTLHTEKLVKY